MAQLKILALSESKSIPDESAIVTKMFDHGLDIFHIRKPDFSRSQMAAYIENIPHKYWNQIVIHSNYGLILKYNLKGIHLSKRKRKEGLMLSLKMYYYKFRKPEIQISTSFHHLSSLFEETRNYDYVFLSPIFDSISKSGYQSGFSHQNLKMSMSKSRFKIIALGGVDVEKIEQVKEMGFSGFIISGALWQNSDPVKSFNEIYVKTTELLKKSLS